MSYPPIRVSLKCANPECEESTDFELVSKKPIVEKHLTTYEITYRCRKCGTKKIIGDDVK